MTAPGPMPEEGKEKRSRRLCVYWGIALALLLALGLFSWLMVPVWRTRTVITRAHVNSPSDLFSKPPAEIIAELGGERRAAERLAQYLRMPDCVAPHRETAATLLGWCGEPGALVASKALSHSDPLVRRRAVAVFWILGSDASAAMPSVVDHLKSSDASTRKSAVQALAVSREFAQSAKPALREALNDKDPSVRQAAAEALKKIKAARQKATPE